MNDYFNDPQKSEEENQTVPIQDNYQNTENITPAEKVSEEAADPLQEPEFQQADAHVQPETAPPIEAAPQQSPVQNYQSSYYQQPQSYDPPNFSPQKSPYYYPNNYSSQQPGNFTPKPPKKSSKGIITFTVLLVVCVAIAVTAMSLALRNSDHPNNINNKPTTNQSSNVITPNNKPTDNNADQIVSSQVSATAEVASKIAPSVVAITVNPNSYNSTAGSGFIVSEDGYIVTNYHVVSNAAAVDARTNISVLLDDGNKYDAVYIAGDSRNDIAVIKIDATGLSAAEIGNSDQLLRGDFVMAVGNPLGEFQGSVSLGVVSGTGRVGIDSSAIPYIQTDAAINPGNSGGPLVNMYGQVVGINTAKVVITGYEGIGFAIPMAYAQDIINELISTGKAPSYAFIGIQYTAITQTQAEYYNVPVGLRIEAIYDQSKVDRNAVQIGDIITEVDGQAIDSTNVLTKILASKQPGDTINVKLYRTNRGLGSEYQTTITLISSSDIEE